jgi:hypothetical protein
LVNTKNEREFCVVYFAFYLIIWSETMIRVQFSLHNNIIQWAHTYYVNFFLPHSQISNNDSSPILSAEHHHSVSPHVISVINSCCVVLCRVKAGRVTYYIMPYFFIFFVLWCVVSKIGREATQHGYNTTQIKYTVSIILCLIVSYLIVSCSLESELDTAITSPINWVHQWLF